MWQHDDNWDRVVVSAAGSKPAAFSRISNEGRRQFCRFALERWAELQ
jgi:hypothetical protein